MSASESRPPAQLPLGIQLRASTTLDSFVAGPNGELLAQLRMLCWPAREEFAPPVMHYLWGADGCGKTHLLQGVCREAAQHGLSAAYLPLAELRAAEPGVIEGLMYQAVVCLDDVESVAGNRGWEEALVGLCDGLRASHGRMLAAGRQAPGELGLLPDLASRLGWGPVYALRALDDEHKLELLRLRAHARGLELTEEVGRYLLTRVSREIPALLAVLERLDRASLAAQRRLTLPFVRGVLLQDG